MKCAFQLLCIMWNRWPGLLIGLAASAWPIAVLAGAQETACDPSVIVLWECRSFVHGAAMPLFDGKSLDGWGSREGNATNDWDVVDGSIHRKSGNGDLYWRSPVRDFVLHFEWRISPGGNSGLKYRVQQYGNQWLGCEYQILDDSSAAEDNKTASLYDVIQPLPGKPIVTAAKWNRSKILVAGNHIEHWLNEVVAVRVSTESAEWREAVAGSKFADVAGFGENREGRLFLQNHGNEVWFRNLILIPLQEQELTEAIPMPMNFAPASMAPRFYRSRSWFPMLPDWR